MQERALALMGRKLTAAQALEGVFSGEGLAALAGEAASMEIALARSLVERLDEGDARRAWSRVFNPRADRGSVATPPQGQLLWPEAAKPAPADLLPAKPRRRQALSTVDGAARPFDGWLF